MKATIDIGTNTVLLLIAEVDSDQIQAIHEEHRSPRLGKGVDEDKNISKEATERVIDALSAYKEIIDAEFPQVQETVVTATSAVRDANNRKEFMQVIKAETGFNIRLLSGREEAEWTAAGALSVLPLTGDNSEILILDIGGGSTEVAHVKNGEVADGFSFDMGSVRFTERFLKSDPPAASEIEECRYAVNTFYNSYSFNTADNIKAVGVAGTLTSLAGMSLDLKSYEPEQLNGFGITPEIVANAIDRFALHGSEVMLEKYPIYLKGRADIFMAGLLILEGFLRKFQISKVKVSTGGIRHGAILKI